MNNEGKQCFYKISFFVFRINARTLSTSFQTFVSAQRSKSRYITASYISLFGIWFDKRLQTFNNNMIVGSLNIFLLITFCMHNLFVFRSIRLRSYRDSFFSTQCKHKYRNSHCLLSVTLLGLINLISIYNVSTRENIELSSVQN